MAVTVLLAILSPVMLVSSASGNPIPSAHCPCAEVTHLLTRAITPEMYTVGLGGLENREGKGGFKEQFTQGGRSRGTAEETRVSSGDFCLTRN